MGYGPDAISPPATAGGSDHAGRMPALEVALALMRARMPALEVALALMRAGCPRSQGRMPALPAISCL